MTYRDDQLPLFIVFSSVKVCEVLLFSDLFSIYLGENHQRVQESLVSVGTFFGHHCIIFNN